MKLKILYAALICLAFIAYDVPAQNTVAGPQTVLNITSEPTDAVVYIDRTLAGNTPLTVRNLTPDEHLISLQKRGYLEYFTSVEVSPDLRSSVDARLEPVTGLLLVHSSPAGADITANGISVGVTPLLITTLQPGTHRLRISSPGYQSKEIEVMIADQTPQKIDVSLISDSGTLNVDCEQEDAEVIVNGVNRGKVPCLIERIPEGDIKLDISAEGFISSSQIIKLAAGETQNVKISLKPMPSTLRVTSLPAKARVYVNNIFQGEAPVEIKDLPAGVRRVRVELPGFDPEARDVTLTRGSTTTEEFRLTANTGRIELTTEPAGAQIYLDGRVRGQTTTGPNEATTISDPLAIEEVSAGEHELRVVRKGYFDKIEKITVERGRTATPHIALARRFIPDYEITTAQGVYRGVLDSLTGEILRLETAPGVIIPFQLKDIRTRRVLREDETLKQP